MTPEQKKDTLRKLEEISKVLRELPPDTPISNQDTHPRTVFAIGGDRHLHSCLSNQPLNKIADYNNHQQKIQTDISIFTLLSRWL